MIYYLLHEIDIFSLNKREDGTMDYGKRNCKLFLIGTFIYIVIYLFLKNLEIKYSSSNKLYMSFVHALFYILVADVLVMAYLYKDFFDRSIIYEAGFGEDDIHIYDGKNHQYYVSKEERKKEIKEKLNKRKERKKLEKINKNIVRDRASVIIQRWWKNILYKPKTGKFYKKTKEHFYKLQLDN